MKTTAKTVQTIRNLAGKLVFSLAVCALVAPTMASAQTPFFPFKDSFNGSIQDNQPVSWYPVLGPETLTVNHGDLILTHPALLSPGFSLGLAIVVADGLPMVAENTSAQAVVRVSDPFAFASVWTKGQFGPPAGDGGAYVAVIRGDGVLAAEIYSLTPPNKRTTLQTPLDPKTTDIVIQLDVFGNKFMASAWAKNRPGKKYRVTLTDTAAPRPPGVLGVGFGGLSDAGEDVAGVSAAFRSFEIKEIKKHHDDDECYDGDHDDDRGGDRD